MAELYRRKPLFEGKYEMDQLRVIFNVIGIPSTADWPANACVVRQNFSDYTPRDLSLVIPDLDDEGKDLLTVSAAFGPQKMNTLLLLNLFLFNYTVATF